jgi:hypothetical protein
MIQTIQVYLSERELQILTLGIGRLQHAEATGQEVDLLKKRLLGALEQLQREDEPRQGRVFERE